MKRYLFAQIRNEWRDNLWMVVELAVVCLVIWYILVSMAVDTHAIDQPLGVDPDDVYVMSFREIPETSPLHVALEGNETNKLDFDAVLDRIRRNPNVEAVGFHMSGLPYNYNFNGTYMMRADVLDSVYYFGNMRWMSPDMVKVLRMESLTGESPGKMMEALSRGEMLVSDNSVYEYQGRDPKSLKGERMVFAGDSSQVFRVGDVVRCIRRSDYEMPYGGTLIFPNVWTGDVSLRVKPGKGPRFESDFRNDASLRGQRNVYFTELRRLNDVRELMQQPMTVNLNLKRIMVFFLIVTIFLGLLGTFWFRIQQRVGEIALRKVCGATKADVLRRVLAEGLILLSVAVIVASLCVWPFYPHVKEIVEAGWKTQLKMELWTVSLMVIGVIVSLWYPAVRAMRIEPALAIKDE